VGRSEGFFGGGWTFGPKVRVGSRGGCGSSFKVHVGPVNVERV
jgi:hypothetical protein